jgi:CHAD domain-containing protein
MSYSINACEPVAQALKRVAREEARYAIAQLTAGEDRHEAIHEARKCIKKLRALLRLLEPQLGNVAGNANRRLRDLGRTLSVLRDSAAMVETFDQLAEQYPGEMGLNRFGGVRERLVAAAGNAMSGADEQALAATAVAEFRKLARHVNLWRLSGEGFAVVADGFNASYEEGRKALRRAEKRPSTENVHELRKRAKDHWYHVRLMGPLWPAASEAYEKAMKDFQETLGDANNASVFLRNLAKDDDGLLREIVIRWRDKLRSQGLSAGSKIYAAKSPPVAAREAGGQRFAGYIL